MNEKLHFTSTNYHRLQEHAAIDELFNLIDPLLLSMRHEDFLKNLGNHASYVFSVQICKLSNTRFKVLVVLASLKLFFGQTFHDFSDDGAGILRYLKTEISVIRHV